MLASDGVRKIGGVVCIYIKEYFNWKVVELEQTSLAEQVWGAINIGSKSILLGCIYRPKMLKYMKDLYE